MRHAFVHEHCNQISDGTHAALLRACFLSPPGQWLDVQRAARRLRCPRPPKCGPGKDLAMTWLPAPSGDPHWTTLLYHSERMIWSICAGSNRHHWLVEWGLAVAVPPPDPPRLHT